MEAVNLAETGFNKNIIYKKDFSKNIISLKKIKFKCNQCGDCCENFYEPDVTFARMAEFDSAGRLIIFSPEGRDVFPLLTWEKRRLEQLAIKHGKEIDFGPCLGVFSRHHKAFFLTHYALRMKYCPFLKDGSSKRKCKIYSERPLWCRTFPIVETGFFNGQVIFENCEKNAFWNMAPSLITNIRGLYRIFKETYLNAMKLSMIEIVLRDLVNLLDMNGTIPLAPLTKDDSRNLHKYQLIDLFDYITKIDFDLRPDPREIIRYIQGAPFEALCEYITQLSVNQVILPKVQRVSSTYTLHRRKSGDQISKKRRKRKRRARGINLFE